MEEVVSVACRTARRALRAAALLMLLAIIAPGVATTAAAEDPEVPCPGFVRTPHDTFDDTGRISVSPPSRELALEPGAVVRRCLLVSNRTGAVQDIELVPVDVDAASNGSQVLKVVPEGEGGFGVSTWISVSRPRVSLNPGDDVVVPFTLTVPDDAPVGTSMGGIAVTGAASGNGEIGFQGRAVSQLIVTLPGAEITKVRVEDVSSPRLLNHGDIGRFEFTAANEGNVIDHVRGTVTITSTLGGRRVARLRSEEGRVLRGGRRDFTIRWVDTPWIGRFEPVLTVTSDGGRVRQQLPAIWVIPPWSYVIALAIAILMPVTVVIVRRRRMNRELLRMIMEDDLDLDESDPDGPLGF